ncbi:MAG: LLM class flavin-dependent oxidoreductase, partial [Mycobacteriales bacterium]
DIVRGLTNGGFFSYQGEFFALASTAMTPAPTAPVPILVGGHSDGALRRAAVRGDGWMHGGGSDDLDQLLARLHELRAEAGTLDRPFEIHVISRDAYTADGIKRLEDKGVTDVIVGFRNAYQRGPDTQPLTEKIAHLERYAENVIAQVR